MMTRRRTILGRIAIGLFVVVAGLGVRSGAIGDTWTFSLRGRSVQARSDSGRLSVALLRDSGSQKRFGWQRTTGFHDALPGPATWATPDLLGVRYAQGTIASQRLRMLPDGSLALTTLPGTYRFLRVYHLHVLGLLALPAIPPALHRRRARLRAGGTLCVQCGYDLRASPGRCPECGAIRTRPA